MISIYLILSVLAAAAQHQGLVDAAAQTLRPGLFTIENLGWQACGNEAQPWFLGYKNQSCTKNAPPQLVTSKSNFSKVWYVEFTSNNTVLFNTGASTECPGRVSLAKAKTCEDTELQVNSIKFHEWRLIPVDDEFRVFRLAAVSREDGCFRYLAASSSCNASAPLELRKAGSDDPSTYWSLEPALNERFLGFVVEKLEVMSSLVSHFITGCMHGYQCGAACGYSIKRKDGSRESRYFKTDYGLDKCCFDHDYRIAKFRAGVTGYNKEKIKMCTKGITKGNDAYCSFDPALITCANKVKDSIPTCSLLDFAKPWKYCFYKHTLRARADAVKMSQQYKLDCINSQSYCKTSTSPAPKIPSTTGTSVYRPTTVWAAEVKEDMEETVEEIMEENEEEEEDDDDSGDDNSNDDEEEEDDDGGDDEEDNSWNDDEDDDEEDDDWGDDEDEDEDDGGDSWDDDEGNDDGGDDDWNDDEDEPYYNDGNDEDDGYYY